MPEEDATIHVRARELHYRVFRRKWRLGIEEAVGPHQDRCLDELPISIEYPRFLCWRIPSTGLGWHDVGVLQFDDLFAHRLFGADIAGINHLVL